MLNRLVSARRGGTLIARYAYDAEGRRIAKRVHSTASGGVLGYTRFAYRAAHVGFETDSAGTIGMKYVWGLNTDDLIAFEDGASVQYEIGSLAGTSHRGGRTQLKGQCSETCRLTSIIITIDPTQFGESGKLKGVPDDFNSVFGHELGHVVGTANQYAQGGRGFCGDRTGCATYYENLVRRDTGMPLMGYPSTWK